MVDWNELLIGFEYQTTVSQFNSFGSIKEWKGLYGRMTWYVIFISSLIDSDRLEAKKLKSVGDLLK